MPGRLAEARLDVDAGQPEFADRPLGLVHRRVALELRVDAGDAEQFVVTMGDAVDELVGQVLGRRVTAYHDGLRQPGLTHFG